MKGKARRLLSWVCVLALCMSLLPVTALASGTNGNNEGTSTSLLSPASIGNDDVEISKTATRTEEDTWEITMTVKAKEKPIESEPLELVLLLDRSGSMAWCTHLQHEYAHNWGGYWCDYPHEKSSEDSRQAIAGNAARDLIDQLVDMGVSASVSVVGFASGASVYQSMTELTPYNKNTIKDKIPTQEASGSTKMNTGLGRAAEQFSDTTSNKVVVLLADGDNDSDSLNNVYQLKKAGVTVHTIGFTTSNDTLQQIADTTGGEYYTADNAEDLAQVFNQIADSLTAMVTDYVGDDVVITGQPTVEVSNSGYNGNGTVNVTPGGKRLTWNPEDDKLTNGQTATIKYSVKLSDSDSLDVGENPVNLNGNAVLTYRVSNSWGGEVQTLKFPVPTDTVEVGQLITKVMLDGKENSTETGKKVIIYGNKQFTWDQPYQTMTVNGTTYTYVNSTYDNEMVTDTAVTAEKGAHTLAHYYTSEQDGAPITIQVILDGNIRSPISGQDVDRYVSVIANGDNGDTYRNGTLSFKYQSYNCADVSKIAADNGYVIEAITADLVYGGNGSKGIQENGNGYSLDNVQGGSTITVYVRTLYTAQFHGTDGQVIQGKTMSGLVAGTTDRLTDNSTAEPTNPSGNGYSKPSTANEGQDGNANSEGMQPETEITLVVSDLKPTITMPDLPDGDASHTVSGWWLDANCEGEVDHAANTTYTVSAENADKDNIIHFYSKSTLKTAAYTVKYVFKDASGNEITNTDDWTNDDNFPKSDTAAIGSMVSIEPPNNATGDNSDNYVLVSTNHTIESISADVANNVITVTYALDNWNGNNDEETGGDGTPDYRQALIKYVSSGNGSVDPQLDVVTLTTTDGNNKYSGSVTADSTATPNDNYAFDYWTKDSNDDWKDWDSELSDTFTAQGGKTYTYTANFAEDTNEDDIPDTYQVFVKFVSADEEQGTVSDKDGAATNTGTTQVYTFKNHATSGDVTPSLAGVDVKANEGFAFDIWTKDDGTDKVNPEALLEAVEGGTTITFYARFTAVENVTVNKEIVKVNNENYDGTSKVNSGDVLTYQITVQNTGGADATNGGNPFVLADTMWKDGAPDNYQVTFTDANGNSQDLTGIYTIEGDSVKIGAIPARSQYVFTYTYTVQQSDEGKTLENTATLAYNAEETIEDTVKVDVEKTHCIITYEYQSGSDGMQLPTEAEGFPPVPASQTLEIGGTVQLPTPETIQVRVEGGVWIFLGWYTDEGLLNPPIIARDDMTIIGLWVFNEAYTLTYDANGGDNGSVPTDSTAYTEGQTATLNTENKPTHAQAPTPEGSVITDEELVDVVFIGWSTTQTDKIFAAGEDYGDIVTQVTFQDQDITVYAVWGYDENGDGIADAQQIVITPADITIYTGGQSYDGIVEGENGEIAENNGMPEPGFYFILPYELDNELGGRGNTEDLTGKLRLHYENGDDIRTWDLALYNEEAGTANKVYGKYYIYRLKPVNNNDLVVRVEIQDGDRLVTSDQFDISLNGELYKEYTMTLYTNSVEQNLVTAQTNVDGTGTDWTPRDTQGIALGTGTLTIRGTNDETPVSPIQGDVIAPVEEITAKAAEGTEYTINDSNLPVVNQDAVQLLNDSLVEGSTDALKDAIVDEAATDDSVTITEDYQFDFCYLDLVDTSNGNAYATTNQPLEIYWPYPDGTNQDTTFYIAHFDGLDREFDPNNLENELNGAELKIYSANTDNSDLKLENTEQGIKISTSTFSPFVLVYNQKDAAAPSLTVDKELTAVNGKTPGSSVSVGDTLTYTITVTNNGNVDLTNVSVKDTFNGKGTLNFAASDDYTATNNNDGTYTITLNSNLAVDNSVKITATYKVLRGDANGTLTNAVSVTGKTTDGTEIPTPGEDTEETPVNPYHPPIRPPEDPDKPELNTEDHYAYIVGYEDGTVQPEGDITRAEVATIFFRLLTDESRNEYWSQTNPYSDVSADDWFNNAVSTLTNAGVLDGYEDGTFKPNGNITRAEFATITARFFEATYDGENLFPDIEGHWAQDYINEAANAGIVNGYEDGTFRPQQYITRAEAVTMVNRTIERHPDADHLLDDMIVWPDNPETAWYYEQIQEATNSHEYTMNTDDEQNPYEIWTNLLPNRDWSELEKEWSDANDGAGSGEVV